MQLFENLSQLLLLLHNWSCEGLWLEVSELSQVSPDLEGQCPRVIQPDLVLAVWPGLPPAFLPIPGAGVSFLSC